MRDLNFFEPYIDKKEFKLDRKLIYSTLAVLIVIVFGFISILNHFNIKQEEATIAKLRLVAEDEQTLEKVAEIKEQEEEIGEFRDSVEKIVLLDESLQETDIISGKLLGEITSKMPNTVAMSSISLGMSDIQIVGVADDKWSIAEFGRGLEGIEDLGEVFVSNISNQQGYFGFNISILIDEIIKEEDVIVDDELIEEVDEEDQD